MPVPTAAAPAHIREHTSVLASSEKRLLIWIARRLPRWLSSDVLSALGFAAMAGAGASFAAFRLSRAGAIGVAACLFLNWFGDSLDGTVARVRHEERPRYGFYVDHVIDLAGTAVLLAGLAVSPLMHSAVALILLAAFLLVSAESYLATHAAGVFRLAFLGVGPTELRIGLSAAALAAAHSPAVTMAGREWLLFDVVGGMASAGLLCAFAASAVRNASNLRNADSAVLERRAQTLSQSGAAGGVAVNADRISTQRHR